MEGVLLLAYLKWEAHILCLPSILLFGKEKDDYGWPSAKATVLPGLSYQAALGCNVFPAWENSEEK